MKKKKKILIYTLSILILIVVLTVVFIFIKNNGPEKYYVKFVDNNGIVLKEEYVEFNKSATSPTPPTKEGYDFVGWDIEFTNVTKDLIVTAQYKIHEHIYENNVCSCGKKEEFKVIFVNEDNSILKEEYVEYNKSATSPTP
ncbi:MAG: InlB B-repeat-containing protein, partial [Bacilli bacterium]|nr:InlB B-repeat-containing protein [Bacilli bacterium]